MSPFKLKQLTRIYVDLLVNLNYQPKKTLRMKSRLILVILISLLGATLTYGQFRIGVRGGINSSRLTTNNVITTGDYIITYPDYAMLGFHAGLISRIQLFSFFIQPEFLYTVTRNNINIYDLKSANPGEEIAIMQKLNRIDIPVMTGFKFKFLRLEAGPVATFLISDDCDLKRITNYDLQLKKATLGYQAGIGLDVGKMSLDVKYEGSLSKFGSGIRVGGNILAFDSRLNQVIVSLGLFF